MDKYPVRLQWIMQSTVSPFHDPWAKFQCVDESEVDQCRVHQNPLRRALHKGVVEHPGTTTSELARVARLHHSTVRYHLESLRKFNAVTACRIHGRIRWFPRTKDFGVLTKRAAAALTSPTQRRILKELQQESALSNGQFSDRLNVTKTNASYHLQRLKTLGLVVQHRDRRYHLAPEAGPALRVLDA